MKLFLTLLIAIFSTLAYGQATREELQKREQELKKELADLNQELKETQKNKKLSLSQLALLQRKVRKREELVNGITKQIHQMDETIFLNERDIYRLRRELDTLRVKYAQSIVFAYKNRSSYEYLNFIFSAGSFNDAIKRITYLRSYRQNRETQVSTIMKSENLLKEKIDELGNDKKQRMATLQSQNEQLKVLQDDKKEQDVVVNQLKGKEKEIAKQLADKEKQRRQVNATIAAVIRRATEEAAREAKAKAAEDARKLAAANKAAAAAKAADKPAGTPSSGSNAGGATNNNIAKAKPVDAGVTATAPARERSYTPLESTPEGLETSIKFENNKGNLPWPVDKGTIDIHFGIEGIPGTKLTRKSDWLEIVLPEGSSVKSIADGEVYFVGSPNGEWTVIIKHGKYFSTYGHLSSVSVQKGQTVRAGTIVGKSGTNIDGDGAMFIMITNEKIIALDPELWLKKRR